MEILAFLYCIVETFWKTLLARQYKSMSAFISTWKETHHREAEMYQSICTDCKSSRSSLVFAAQSSLVWNCQRRRREYFTLKSGIFVLFTHRFRTVGPYASIANINTIESCYTVLATKFLPESMLKKHASFSSSGASHSTLPAILTQLNIDMRTHTGSLPLDGHHLVPSHLEKSMTV